MARLEASVSKLEAGRKSKKFVAIVSGYSCAFASVALALGARLLLDPALGMQVPFPTILLAVLVTAWYGGLRPALVAVVLGAVTSDFFLLPPRGHFKLVGLDQQAALGLYILTGLGISLIGGVMHTARHRAGSSAESARQPAALIDQ